MDDLLPWAYVVHFHPVELDQVPQELRSDFTNEIDTAVPCKNVCRLYPLIFLQAKLSSLNLRTGQIYFNQIVSINNLLCPAGLHTTLTRFMQIFQT